MRRLNYLVLGLAMTVVVASFSWVNSAYGDLDFIHFDPNDPSNSAAHAVYQKSDRNFKALTTGSYWNQAAKTSRMDTGKMESWFSFGANPNAGWQQGAQLSGSEGVSGGCGFNCAIIRDHAQLSVGHMSNDTFGAGPAGLDYIYFGGGGDTPAVPSGWAFIEMDGNSYGSVAASVDNPRNVVTSRTDVAATVAWTNTAAEGNRVAWTSAAVNSNQYKVLKPDADGTETYGLRIGATGGDVEVMQQDAGGNWSTSTVRSGDYVSLAASLVTEGKIAAGTANGLEVIEGAASGSPTSTSVNSNHYVGLTWANITADDVLVGARAGGGSDVIYKDGGTWKTAALSGVNASYIDVTSGGPLGGSNYHGSIGGGVFGISSSACDFTGDGACGLADINDLMSQGNLVAGVSATGIEGYDLNSDGSVDEGDIGAWLSQAASANGHGNIAFTAGAPVHGAYQRGDTDGLDTKFGTAERTVDITDFENFLNGFTGSGATWEVGNFNGDGQVDITDFSIHFLSGFQAASGGAYGGNQVPEPSTVVLLGLGGLLLAHLLYRRKK